MEAFVEILLKRKITLLDRIVLFCLISGVVLVSVVGVCLSKFIFSLLPLVVVLDFFIVYHIILHKQVEFEYIVIGDEIDIDKIFGKRKRKKLITVRKSDVVFFGIVEDEEYENRKKQSFRVIDASSGYNEKNFYILLNDKKKTLLILEKDERLFKVIKR